jgi:hypothetical protein
MGCLHPVRLHFSGRFRADVSTVNNNLSHFNNDEFDPSFQTPGQGTGNGQWQPAGTAAWRAIPHPRSQPAPCSTCRRRGRRASRCSRSGADHRPDNRRALTDAIKARIDTSARQIFAAGDNGIGTQFARFRRMEGAPHGFAHTSFDGPVNNPPTAPKDPLFFLLHVNVDRLWAFWEPAL